MVQLMTDCGRLEPAQIVCGSGARQGIKNDHLIATREQGVRYVATEESTAAGYQNLHDEAHAWLKVAGMAGYGRADLGPI